MLPREHVFTELFAECAALGVQAAGVLGQVLAAPVGPHRDLLAAQLSELEHDADAGTHEVVRRLNSTFVPPFDREDIYALARRLDDCLDIMETVAARVVAYQLDALPEGVLDRLLDQATILQRQAELTAAAMARLAGVRGLADYWVEVNSLENEAERVHRLVLTSLFASRPVEGGAQIAALMDVSGLLHAGAQAYERVAHTVELLAVKET